MQSTLNESSPLIWEELAPLLDEAMASLGDTDRNVVALRYFENKSATEIAQAMRLNEEAAKKRVHRALEKLRKFFVKRGVESTTAMIAEVISANSVQATPAGLAQMVSAAAMAKGTAASASTITLVKGALKIMAWTKMKTAAVVGVGVLLVAGTVTVTVKTIRHSPEYYKGKTLKQWLVNLDDQRPGPANDEAEAAVRHFGTNGLPTIISMLKMKDPMHHNAVLACQILGPGAGPAMPDLVNLLKSGYTYGYVGVALGDIGPEAVPSLLELATNGNAQAQIGSVQLQPGVTESASDLNAGVRCEAVVTLGDMTFEWGTNDVFKSNVIPALIKSLEDQSPSVRALAARSLGQIASEETTVVPALIRILNDPDFQTRWSSCLALGKFGKNAGVAAPALQAALHDRKAEVRACAAIALVQIEPDNATQLNSLMPVLIENINGLGGRDTNFRSTTADTLAALGNEAKPAAPALLNGIKKSSGYEQQLLVADLKKIDPDAAAKAGWK